MDERENDAIVRLTLQRKGSTCMWILYAIVVDS